MDREPCGTVKRVIVFNLSRHGLLDLNAYESYLHSKLQDA
jgi:predicted alternative tryptophan synthase beta-subunit